MVQPMAHVEGLDKLGLGLKKMSTVALGPEMLTLT